MTETMQLRHEACPQFAEKPVSWQYLKDQTSRIGRPSQSLLQNWFHIHGVVPMPQSWWRPTWMLTPVKKHDIGIDDAAQTVLTGRLLAELEVELSHKPYEPSWSLKERDAHMQHIQKGKRPNLCENSFRFFCV
jgi:hypothetical protein